MLRDQFLLRRSRATSARESEIVQHDVDVFLPIRGAIEGELRMTKLR